MKSLKNSSMAERLRDAFNEHAVDNPEEIASMVDTSIRDYTVRRSLNFSHVRSGIQLMTVGIVTSIGTSVKRGSLIAPSVSDATPSGDRDERYHVVTRPER
ncbi:hypothetical protein VNO77_14837 [Canavalia gladiata]|uniref:Uncharacterized protein n=1 Tax=Canavalia gladiata TaxID=3824 RepID=A0AAN9LYG5_CANGL